jgi:hypothetical protein
VEADVVPVRTDAPAFQQDLAHDPVQASVQRVAGQVEHERVEPHVRGHEVGAVVAGRGGRELVRGGAERLPSVRTGVERRSPGCCGGRGGFDRRTQLAEFDRDPVAVRAPQAPPHHARVQDVPPIRVEDGDADPAPGGEQAEGDEDTHRLADDAATGTRPGHQVVDAPAAPRGQGAGDHGVTDLVEDPIEGTRHRWETGDSTSSSTRT